MAMDHTKRSLLPLALGLAITGCASDPQRRSVEELYESALKASRLDGDPARSSARKADEARVRMSALGPPDPSTVVPKAGDAALGPLVSEVFVGTDVREALQLLASQAKVIVTMDEGVQGTVSASFETVPFEVALSHLLAPRGYIFKRQGAGFLVGLDDPGSAMFPLLAEQHCYRPRHLSPKDLAELLPERLRRCLTVSDKHNLLIVTAARGTAQRVLASLAELDKAVPQVMIEAIICEYKPSSSLETGFDFEHGFKAGAGQHANIGLTGLAATGVLAPSGAPGLKSFEFYRAFMRNLATEGYVSIRAAPRILALDGERASINIGEDTYFTVGDGQNLLRQLETVHSGISLDLTSRVQGSQVRIKIEKAEVSDELRPSISMAEGGAVLPTVNARRVTTTVTVSNGQTIVIGGLRRKRQIDKVTRIPILGQIPLLGFFFQRREEREEETEVAIFISPRIVKESP